jgi:long-chain acyl-CoA synthetase
MAERLVYGGVLQARYRGRPHVPRDGPFIVAANHLSHLDAGLVRTALGRSGEHLFVLAATDTFFDTALKRAFFSHFAGLLPLARVTPDADSLRRAVETIEKGFSVLVFPEGTRSRSGGLQEFRRGVGYLALRARVGVLPVKVDTHGALPPGSVTLKSRRVEAHIGPFLGYDDLARAAAGRARADAEREVTRIVREAIERLGKGTERRPARPLRPEAPAEEVEVE